ncbi:substrate-binding domain-containing protein [Noviherbaspirillum galbum]|uniref:ABC transporter substrate-binding protein n=1 Tax=Noviherbaspirillum galbum TaxID=2709383 RepID=A0A6B3SS08_9BURK|nr:substrate-binding domain-containing protein [Noviherbaspirillum galbum]NEX63720.1 ABC transporter substrate-binding protein [Noviherbaspirillum galbum]
MFRSIAVTLGAVAAMSAAGAAFAQSSGPIRIALIASKTGPSETYARDTERGVRLGLEYLTNNTMAINGRKIELIVKDDQFKPELSKALLAEAYGDDKADIAIGTSWSGGALAMMPVAAEYRKIFIAEPAIADSITGEKSNRYVFRASRNSFQDALATAVTAGKGANIAFLAPDYVYGRDGVKSFKEALAAIKSDAKVVHEEYIPLSTSDFTASYQRIVDALKDKQGPKKLYVVWGAPNPIKKIADMGPERYGIQIGSVGGASLDYLKNWPGLNVEGGTFYYYNFPKNKMNDWLVAEHQKRYKVPPDLFTAGGFTAIAAAIEGIRKAGSTDTNKLIAAMEGMTFDTPKGPITFRKEDHQGMQSQYYFRTKKAGQDEWDLLELVREIPASEMPVPIGRRNGN